MYSFLHSALRSLHSLQCFFVFSLSLSYLSDVLFLMTNLLGYFPRNGIEMKNLMKAQQAIYVVVWSVSATEGGRGVTIHAERKTVARRYKSVGEELINAYGVTRTSSKRISAYTEEEYSELLHSNEITLADGWEG